MGKKLPKKLGRPPVMGESRMRSFRIPDAEYAQWEMTARAHGLTVSEWLRRVCNKQATKDGKKEKG